MTPPKAIVVSTRGIDVIGRARERRIDIESSVVDVRGTPNHEASRRGRLPPLENGQPRENYEEASEDQEPDHHRFVHRPS